jgi:hypothetical protein
MTYPKYDSTTFKFSTATNTAIPIKYSKTGYRITVVDGWGSVTTPYGTANCLRLITTQYSQDSIKNNFVPFPIGFPNYQRSYQWLTTASKIPFLEISGSLSPSGSNFTPTQARYRDNPVNIQGISEENDISAMILYPNPVKDQLFFNAGKQHNYKIEIYDLKGSLVCSPQPQSFQESVAAINVSGLNPGLYVVKVKGDASAFHMKFIKE